MLKYTDIPKNQCRQCTLKKEEGDFPVRFGIPLKTCHACIESNQVREASNRIKRAGIGGQVSGNIKFCRACNTPRAIKKFPVAVRKRPTTTAKCIDCIMAGKPIDYMVDSNPKFDPITDEIMQLNNALDLAVRGGETDAIHKMIYSDLPEISSVLENTPKRKRRFSFGRRR